MPAPAVNDLRFWHCGGKLNVKSVDSVHAFFPDFSPVGLHNGLLLLGAAIGIGNIPDGIGSLQLLGHIVHPELIKFDFWQFQIFGAVIAVQLLGGSICFL